MSRPHEHWTVLPHGKLTEIDAGILTVVGEIHMPLVTLPRRMTVVRLADARLVVWSAIALDETEMATLDFADETWRDRSQQAAARLGIVGQGDELR